MSTDEIAGSNVKLDTIRYRTADHIAYEPAAAAPAAGTAASP